MTADLLNAVRLTERGEGRAATNYRGPEVRVCCIYHRICTALCSSHFANESQSFRFSVKTGRSTLAGGLEKMSPGPEPALGSHACMGCKFTWFKTVYVYLRGNLKTTEYSPTVPLLVQWNSNKIKRADSHRDMGLLGYYAAYSGNS